MKFKPAEAVDRFNRRMDKRAFPLPDQHDYEYALGLAYELACEQLANLLENLEEQCRRSDAQCQTTDSRKAVIVHFR